MDLEPADRNPAELRRTAFFLVLIMIVGAAFVLYAYKKHEESSDPDRPPITAKITRNLAAKNQRDEFASLSFLEGKVWFAAPFCVSQLEENKHAISMMKELDAHYKTREDVHFVLISIEGTDLGVTPEKLAKAEKQLGVDGSRWTLLTSNDTKKQRGYIKDQLRLGLVIERKGDELTQGKWKFPSQIALVDREFHLRQRYDFKEIFEAQEHTRQLIAEDKSLENNEKAQFLQNAVENQKAKLIANTDYVLKETQTGKVE